MEELKAIISQRGMTVEEIIRNIRRLVSDQSEYLINLQANSQNNCDTPQNRRFTGSVIAFILQTGKENKTVISYVKGQTKENNYENSMCKGNQEQ